MTWDSVHDSRHTFLACLGALCAPATRVAIAPSPGLVQAPALDTACAVLLSLLDPGLTLAASGSAADEAADRLIRLTGATRAPVHTADFVLVVGEASAIFQTARRGTPTHPEAGATIVVVASSETASAKFSGPGIQSPIRGSVPLSDIDLENLAHANSEPPSGIDVLIADAGELIALPRTSRIQLGVR